MNQTYPDPLDPEEPAQLPEENAQPAGEQPYYPPAEPAPAAAMPQAPTAVVPQAPVAKTKWGLAIGLLIAGLLIGGAAGYFGGYFFVFQPAQEKAAAERTQLEERISSLEAQIVQLQATTDTTGVAPGVGVAPTVSGITPDPITDDWAVYANQDFHFTFRYPSDFELRELPLGDDLLFAIAIFRPGSEEEAGSVRVYKSELSEGPSKHSLLYFIWPDQLPTRILEKAAGAGLLGDVSEKSVILNGTSATELGALEGVQTQATPGGQTYQAYLVEEQFANTYLVGTCGSDQTKQNNLVACPLLTTFMILPSL